MGAAIPLAQQKQKKKPRRSRVWDEGDPGNVRILILGSWGGELGPCEGGVRKNKHSMGDSLEKDCWRRSVLGRIWCGREVFWESECVCV